MRLKGYFSDVSEYVDLAKHRFLVLRTEHCLILKQCTQTMVGDDDQATSPAPCGIKRLIKFSKKIADKFPERFKPLFIRDLRHSNQS